jgi:hypothetical protein
MPAKARNDFVSDYRTVQERIRAGVVPSHTTKADHTWKLWMEFCNTHSVNPWFHTSTDPLPFLQVLGPRYRKGKLSPANQPVRAGIMADALRMMGQAYQQLGSRDFRIDKFTGKLDFRLQRQLKAYEKQDSAPTRVKPVPLQLVQHNIMTTARKPCQTSEAIKAVVDMTCTAFFFLLRQGEYTVTNDNKSFRLQDTHLYIGQRHIHPHQASQGISLK